MIRTLPTLRQLGLTIIAITVLTASTLFASQLWAQSEPSVAVVNTVGQQGPADNSAIDNQNFRRVPGVIYYDQGNQPDNEHDKQDVAGSAMVDSDASSEGRIAGSAEVDTESRLGNIAVNSELRLELVPSGTAANNVSMNCATPIDVVLPSISFTLPDRCPPQQVPSQALATSGTMSGTFVNASPQNAEFNTVERPANIWTAFETHSQNPASLPATEGPFAPQYNTAQSGPTNTAQSGPPRVLHGHSSQPSAALSAHQPAAVAIIVPRERFSLAQRLQPTAIDQDQVIKLPVVTGSEVAPMPSPLATGQASGHISGQALGKAELKDTNLARDCVREMPIGTVGTNIAISSSGDVPKDTSEVCHPEDLRTAYAMTPHAWMPVCYRWEAPSLCYGPLYFEENNLERYGYSQTYVRSLQPLASSARFFVTVPMLPYLVYAEPAHECNYILGEYRPGSCVPYQWNYPYFSRQWPWRTCDDHL